LPNERSWIRPQLIKPRTYRLIFKPGMKVRISGATIGWSLPTATESFNSNSFSVRNDTGASASQRSTYWSKSWRNFVLHSPKRSTRLRTSHEKAQKAQN